MSQNKNIYKLFQSQFSQDLSKPFLKHERGITTFTELEYISGQFSVILKKTGVKKGDRVVVQVEKSPESVLLYLACLRIGAIYIPLNSAYTVSEVKYFVNNAKPRLVVCDPRVKKQISDEILTIEENPDVTLLTLDQHGAGSIINQLENTPTDPSIEECTLDDIAAILYTSGTTGRSKGAMLTHGNLISNATVLHEYWEWDKDDVLLHALPIFHIHGLFVALHCALLNASTVIFHTRFNIDAIIEDLPHSTVLMGVPTFYTRLLENTNFNQGTCRNMRLFIAGSAPLLAESFKSFEELTGHKILERYGMTEAGMITSNPYNGDRVAGTVGFALPGVTARIANSEGQPMPIGEVGILEIKGNNVFAGYWKMPEKTAEEFHSDGFFITGDMAIMDEEQRISIVGRAKDLVISGGFNIYPKEIESIIDEIEGVKESAVFGIAHPDFGEGLTAEVVTEADTNISTDSIKALLSNKLAKFKQPKKIFIVQELPRNTMGKVQKKTLREKYVDIYS